MGRQKLSKSTIATRLRQHKALELRLAGLGFQEIADRVGYRGPGSAYSGIQAALKRECPQEEVERLRAIMSARLLRLLRGVWKHATGNPPDVQYVDRALKILERLCRLHGIDKPIEIKSDMTISATDPLEGMSIEELGNLAELFTKYTQEDLDFLIQVASGEDTGGDGEAPPDYR